MYPFNWCDNHVIRNPHDTNHSRNSYSKHPNDGLWILGISSSKPANGNDSEDEYNSKKAVAKEVFEFGKCSLQLPTEEKSDQNDPDDEGSRDSGCFLTDNQQELPWRKSLELVTE